MALSHSPKIVSDGLVLCLDAENIKSYPGTGTTWFDMSKNSNNGSLLNGVVYTRSPISGIRNMISPSQTSNSLFPTGNSWGTNASPSFTQQNPDPDGGTGAIRIISNGNSTSGIFRSSGGGTINLLPVESGKYYTFSARLKGYSDQMITRLQLVTPFPSNTLAEFNLNTGTIHRVLGGAIAHIEPIGDGWYLCSVSGISNNSGNFSVTNYAGVSGDTGWFAYGYQVEEGAVATPYQNRISRFTILEQGIPNRCTMYFNGASAGNNYCNFSSNFFDYTQNSATFELWTRPESWINDASNCVDKRTYPMTVYLDNLNFIGFITDSSNRFKFGPRGSLISAPSVMELNNWYHLVGTFANPGSAFYINGELIDTRPSATISSNPTAFRLGWNNFNCTNAFYKGNISVARIYNKILSPEEIKQNYNVLRGRYGI